MDEEFKRLEELDEKSREEVVNRIKQCLDLYFRNIGISKEELSNNFPISGAGQRALQTKKYILNN